MLASLQTLGFLAQRHHPATNFSTRSQLRRRACPQLGLRSPSRHFFTIVLRPPPPICRTLDHHHHEGALASFHPSGPNGAITKANKSISVNSSSSSGSSANTNANNPDTLQQLRQAVLSSLDFSDNSEATQDWDDWDDSGEEIITDGGQVFPTGAPSSGKAVYEVQRIDRQGKSRRVYVRRRDLIRTHNLQPRDLRRIDPSLAPTKTSPSVAIKGECVLVNVGGVRAIITADRCLLFEPTSPSSRKFMELVLPKLQSSAAAERARAQGYVPNVPALESVSMSMSMSIDGYGSSGEGFEGVMDGSGRMFPFELEILEGALMVATGKLEAELVAATRRVGAVLQKLPREITPVNLEELRRVKQLLVELESKAENLRDLLTEVMDDEEEVAELNLSSRPKREEKRRQRERERLEREVEREREREMNERGGHARNVATTNEVGVVGSVATTVTTTSSSSTTTASGGSAPTMFSPMIEKETRTARKEKMEELEELNEWQVAEEEQLSRIARDSEANPNPTNPMNPTNPTHSTMPPVVVPQQKLPPSSPNPAMTSANMNNNNTNNNNKRSSRSAPGGSDSDDEDSGANVPQAQDALEEIADKEEEERELEEVEDLLEYYLQRAATTQSEAERLLAGARDLEESIGVSLSARRFEVNRLELMLSIASFAAALGAMVASIFGMNLRSTLEMSVIGFWGTTIAIVAGSCWVFWVLYKYTKGKRIL